MKSIQKLLLTVLCVLAFATVSAKTVSWTVSPKYDKISRYSSDIFVFLQNGKWGLVKLGNNEIISAKYDYITPFINGYALAGTKEGSRYRLECIISETGESVLLNEKYYLPPNNQYFSQGKMVVENINGKYGYINADGNVVIKCQFDKALPFKEGWAPVKQGNYFKYITDNYDRDQSRNILIVDFHYGEMTMASCFYNGNAAIAYNKNFALIGTNGKKIKKLNEADFKKIYKNNNSTPTNSGKFTETNFPAEFIQNGLVGLKNDNNIIVKPQFDMFITKFNDNLIIASINGKQGILLVSDDDYNIDFISDTGSKSELKVDKNGQVEGVKLNFISPVVTDNLKLFLDCGNGEMQDFSSHISQKGTNTKVSFSPIITNNPMEYNAKAIIENDGIIVAEADNLFNLSYPVILRLSAPKAISSKADKNDNVTIYAYIYNDSNIEVTVTATLVTKQRVTETYTIPPHGSSKISISEKITYEQTINTFVSLNTGDKETSTLTLEPYF